MITRRLTRRIVCRTAVLSAAVALAMAAPVSAEAETGVANEHFRCQILDDGNAPDEVAGQQCEPMAVGPLEGPVILEDVLNGVVYTCENGVGFGRDVRGFDCERSSS
jgi:hypothetical protein